MQKFQLFDMSFTFQILAKISVYLICFTFEQTSNVLVMFLTDPIVTSFGLILRDTRTRYTMTQILELTLYHQ